MGCYALLIHHLCPKPSGFSREGMVLSYIGRVLVVDDQADVRKTVSLILQKEGYDVIEAENGEAGIQSIKSGDNPMMVDAIICDMQMPKVNGMEAIGFFRDQFPSVPVVVLTGNPDIKDANILFKSGIVEYLTKPIDPENLKTVIKKAVESHVFKDKFAT